MYFNFRSTELNNGINDEKQLEEQSEDKLYERLHFQILYYVYINKIYIIILDLQK